VLPAEPNPTTSRCRRMRSLNRRCCHFCHCYQTTKRMSCRDLPKLHMRQRRMLPRPLFPTVAAETDSEAGPPFSVCEDAGKPWGDNKSGHDTTFQSPASFSRNRYPSWDQICLKASS
jgi:hypothetical protein